MKVLIIIPRAHFPADWPHTIPLAYALRKQKIFFHILMFTRQGVAIPEDLKPHISAIFEKIPWWFRLFNPASVRLYYKNQIEHWMDLVLESLFCSVKALFLIRSMNITAVHFTDGFSPISILFAIVSKRRVVHKFCAPALCLRAGRRSLLDRIKRWFIDRAIASNRIRFVFENKFTANDCTLVLGAKAVYIPLAVLALDHGPDQLTARSRLDIPLREKVFVMFGSHVKIKDYDTIFKAAAMINPAPLLLFAGRVIDNNPCEVALKNDYRNFRVINEFVPESEAINYFRSADAAILSYIPGTSEAGGSGVLFVSLQYDCPVIAARNRFFDDIISEYGCGLQFEYGNARDLSLCMQKMIDSDEAMRSRMAAGLKRFKEDHAWNHLIARYLELYKG